MWMAQIRMVRIRVQTQTVQTPVQTPVQTRTVVYRMAQSPKGRTRPSAARAPAMTA